MPFAAGLRRSPFEPARGTSGGESRLRTLSSWLRKSADSNSWPARTVATAAIFSSSDWKYSFT